MARKFLCKCKHGKSDHANVYYEIGTEQNPKAECLIIGCDCIKYNYEKTITFSKKPKGVINKKTAKFHGALKMSELNENGRPHGVNPLQQKRPNRQKKTKGILL